MDNEKLAGLKDRLVSRIKDIGGRRAEKELAITNKLIHEGRARILKGHADNGVLDFSKDIAYHMGEAEKFRGEVKNINDRVFKARIGAGVMGGAALTAAGYAAKKYVDNSVQTELADRDKVAYFNPAPWADDVMNSYAQVRLVWEQKKREAERMKREAERRKQNE